MPEALPELLFATHNRNKVAEVSALLAGRYHVVSAAELALPDVDETGDTLEANAMLKARAGRLASGRPCFADDSGLEVDALDGAPGVYSARYAGAHGDADANMTKLLAALQGQSNRRARFRTVIAFCDDAQHLHLFSGELQGHIIHERRGANGFGYDPIFMPEGLTQTLAELEPAAKNAISHRGRALAAFLHFLTQSA